jgi:hypothetical protein
MSFLGKIDGDARYRTDAPGEVDHGASARENLSAAGRDLKEMLPDKTMEAIRLYAEAASWRDMEHLGLREPGDPNPWKLLLKAAIKFPIGLVRDAAELAIMPLLAVKDGADAAAHGIAAGLRGKRDR